MFFLRTAFFSVAVVMFLPAGAWNSHPDGQPTAILRAAPEMDFTLEGTVHTLDHNKLTVHTEDNIIFHVNYDDKTEFKDEDGKPAHDTDLKAGLRIRVEGDLAESGEIAAQRITLLKAPPPK